MKIGDYVRTKNGLIAKIVNINDFREPSLKYGIEANYIVDIGFIGDEDIKISSPNIIDLIEVGDYVNGELIVDIGINMNNEKVIFYIIPSDYCEDWFKEENIKSIVTKEQFEKREYKVGE